jgi:hypothetical protein
MADRALLSFMLLIPQTLEAGSGSSSACPRTPQPDARPLLFELPSALEIRASCPPVEQQLPSPSQVFSTVKLRNYSIQFVSYADGKPYTSTQRLQIKSAPTVGGADLVTTWSRALLEETEWGKRVLPRFYRHFPLSARYVWKPYVILDALERMRDDDFVIYADASKYHRKGFAHSFVPLTNYLSANVCGALDPRGPRFGFVPGMRLKFRNRRDYFWPRRCELCEQLALMGLCPGPKDDACCESYWRAPHTQASFSIWQKNPLALHFLRTWLADCEDLRVLNRSLAGDQCVATLLVSAWSRARGLRVPWLYNRRSGNGRPLKDPNLLFGAYGGADQLAGRRSGLPYLLDTDPYPECARGVADANLDCLPPVASPGRP